MDARTRQLERRWAENPEDEEAAAAFLIGQVRIGLDRMLIHCATFLGSRACGAAVEGMAEEFPPHPSTAYRNSYGHYWLERLGRLMEAVRDDDQRAWVMCLVAHSVIEADVNQRWSRRGIKKRIEIKALELSQEFLRNPTEENRANLLLPEGDWTVKPWHCMARAAYWEWPKTHEVLRRLVPKAGVAVQARTTIREGLINYMRNYAP